jgi:transposase
MSQKPQLTVNERIKAAYLHYVLGIEQQAVAVAFEVNIGRVNEACLAIKLAAEDPKHLQANNGMRGKKSEEEREEEQKNGTGNRETHSNRADDDGEKRL